MRGARAILAGMLAVQTAVAALPAPALEAMDLRCVAARSCDAGGSCTAEEGVHVLRIRPIFARDDGSTRLEVEIDGGLRDGSALTDRGPILWREGREDLQTLLLLGDGAALWHRPEATDPVLFLACEAAP